MCFRERVNLTVYDKLGRSTCDLSRVSSKDLTFCFKEYLLFAEMATMWCDRGSRLSLKTWTGASSSNKAVFPPFAIRRSLGNNFVKWLTCCTEIVEKQAAFPSLWTIPWC